MANKITQEEFINRAKNTHGDTYGYSQTQYVNSITSVDILCPKHGIFTQTPSSHTRGCGCPVCGRRNTNLGIKSSNNQRRSNTTDFIKKAKLLHETEKFDYSCTHYINCKTKVEIVCPKHGSFLQTPNKHLSGSGCPKCANKHVTTDEFIEKCKAVHNNKYNYDRVIYMPGYTKVEIVCPKHGSFFQITYNHLSNKQGCPGCKHEKAQDNIGVYNQLFF